MKRKSKILSSIFNTLWRFSFLKWEPNFSLISCSIGNTILFCHINCSTQLIFVYKHPEVYSSSRSLRMMLKSTNIKMDPWGQMEVYSEVQHPYFALYQAHIPRDHELNQGVNCSNHTTAQTAFSLKILMSL